MKTRLIARAGLALLASAWMAAAALAAEVTARVDRNEIVEGETITLILQTDDPQQSLSTDLSGLEQQFAVLDQRSETQMSIVNGQQTAVVRLVVTLEPLQEGRAAIPPLAFEGGARTPAIPVTVKPAPELAPGELPPVFLELELDPADGPYYVHAQLSLTVRIFYQQNLTEAAINPPTPEQASVRLLDEVPFQSTRNGTRFRVLERRYAIFPERSGELLIPPLALTGRLIERPADRLWQPSVRGRRVRVESEPVTVEVLPRPADYPGDHWLPARRITLSQQISDAQGLRVGEPVTRTIILDAVGLEENMIEEPVWPDMPNARIYPDQPQGISRDDGKWVLGHKEFRYAVVPEVAGELVLPEIRLTWWDTTENTVKTAVLPEHRVAVAESGLTPDIAPPAVGPDVGAGNGAGSADRTALNRWRLGALVLGMLWLATLWLYVRKGAGDLPQRNGREQETAGERELLDALRAACKAGEASQARQLISRWLRRHGPAAAHGSLVEFAGLVNEPDLEAAIYDLNGDSFRAGEDGAWDGKRLWRLFSAWLASREQTQPEESKQPDLYAAAR